MKRSKRHRVKQELPETSTTRYTGQKDHDLTYYIHDRVELVHQVFSVLKSKELKAMAPECVRHISLSDLQELCMEELLGISSKRLCAILDGATPPSDTESSSESEPLETISLDSISSDEEILSEISSKKSKKHKHRSKSKPKKRKSKDNDDGDKDQADRSRRAGLTVLELLELQARARAIRAQLQQEQASAVSTGRPSESVTGHSDDEVEIKEEAAEVVEISSEDEKPNVQKLEERITATNKDSAQDASSNSKTITKTVNNLIITVPKTNTSRKIKLKRNTSTNSKAHERAPENEISSKTTSNVVLVEDTATSNRKHASKSINQETSTISVDAETTQNSQSKADKPTKDVVNAKDKNRSKDKKKKRKKGKQSDKYGSDHDEITLQLSDTEKMDLLEDLDEKKHDKCSGTEDSKSDSSDDSLTEDSDEDKHANSIEGDTHNTNLDKDKVVKESSTEIGSEPVSIEKNISDDNATKEVEGMLGNKTSLDSNSLIVRVDERVAEKDKDTSNEKADQTGLCDIDENAKTILEDKSTELEPTGSAEKENVISEKNTMEISSSHDIPLVTRDVDTSLNEEQTINDVEMEQEQKQCEEKSSEINIEINSEIVTEDINVSDKVLLSNSELTTIDTMPNNEAGNANTDNLNEKSEGELSDRDSSEVEASDFKPDVVCISDDEDKKGKKKKKKDKKSKKEKKSKKKKDFRESGDQNFYSDKSNVPNQPNTSENEVVIISEGVINDDSSSKCDSIRENVREKEIIIVSEIEENKSKYQLKNMENLKPELINTDSDLDDDVYEILELSGDSSCYEVEEISISMEPTAEEIEALSAKVDELERDTVIDNTNMDKVSEESDTLSWKERYLKSNKVKKVLTTANIMNAMRKKNLELKKKLQESKKDKEIEETEKKSENVEEAPTNVEDGSIEQYNTLEASTKYVDPVKDANESTDNTDENGSKDKTAEEKNGTKDTVTREMKKDAKQLLKMYKMLLKYNDMTLQKDPNKKKKKKKKNKEKEKSAPIHVTTA